MPGLRDNNSTASNSFGLHYGSASLNLTGSLVCGGYDHSTVLGSVSSFDLGFINSMVDISFSVESGGSPFRDGSIPRGLLQGKSSNTDTSTIVDPIIPYLLLSGATCSAIAQNLPMTFQPSLGLYTWNTANLLYTSILKAPTYLSFTFLNVSTTRLTINVPLQLLNLTFTPPLVSKPQQYFPCRPYTATNTDAGNGAYFLGPAFLQAAFVGVKWEQGKFVIAQAPGPAVGASQIVPVVPRATNIASNDISEFAAGWIGTQYWTALSRNSTGPSDGSSGGGGGGELSGGAFAGIVVGIVVGAVLLFSVIWFCVRRRSRSSANTAADDGTYDKYPPQVHEMTMDSARHDIGYQDPQELGYRGAREGDGAARTLRYKMDGQQNATRGYK